MEDQKRGAVYGVIALLLLRAAAYLNWSYVDTPEDLLRRRSRPTRRRIRRPMPRRTSTAGEGRLFCIPHG